MTEVPCALNLSLKTVDQAAAEYKVPARYKGYKETVNESFASAKTNLQVLYNELKR